MCSSDLWTMGQQFIVIRNMPTPGSEAALAREARLARKAQRRQKGSVSGALAAVNDITVTEMEAPRATPQRQQPVGKNRAKKNGKK